MPSLPGIEQPSDPRLAALVAINIVTQVLDEAEDILNIANDSGKSWRYVWHQKQDKQRYYVNNEILEILDVKVNDNDINNSEIIKRENVIVTSTPQKEIRDVQKTYNESGFIGQGDEEIETKNIDIRTPSMLINCLFDMGEVEQEGTIEVFDDIQVGSDSRNFVASTITQLVDSYINVALNIACGDSVNFKHQVLATSFDECSSSSYSLLSDVQNSDDTENENTKSIKVLANSLKEHSVIQTLVDEANVEDSKEIIKKEFALYEKTFLTLNHDYEKYSEDEDLLVDGTTLPMQEVELPTMKSSEELAVYSEPSQVASEPAAVKKLLLPPMDNCGDFQKGQREEKISVVAKTWEEDPITSMKAMDTDKNSLVKRCRLQGAKLMSRLRSWWWRQRLIGKRKGRRSGSCSVTSEARNRAASLLDHRKLRSPSPSRTIPWKFNTINEALIHSYNTNDFELEINNAPVQKN